MKETSFDTFKEMVMESIKSYLDDSYQDYEMKIQTIKKSSGYEYEALMISPNDRTGSVVPALNLSDAFERYQNGLSFDEVMEKLADIRMNATLSGFKKEDLLDYDTIKERIFPRLVNSSSNEEYLSDKPHKEIVDLSIYYAVRVSEDESGFAEAVITDDLVNMWNIDLDELHSQAMENNSKRPLFFKNIEDVLFGGAEESSYEIEDINLDDFNIPYFILTTLQKSKGAVMAITPAIMSRIIAKFGEVYIIPSSVDETLVVSKRNVDDIQELVKMVTQVNSTEVRPEDQLSNNIYEYDLETQSIRIANNCSAQIA